MFKHCNTKRNFIHTYTEQSVLIGTGILELIPLCKMFSLLIAYIIAVLVA